MSILSSDSHGILAALRPRVSDTLSRAAWPRRPKPLASRADRQPLPRYRPGRRICDGDGPPHFAHRGADPSRSGALGRRLRELLDFVNDARAGTHVTPVELDERLSKIAG